MVVTLEDGRHNNVHVWYSSNPGLIRMNTEVGGSIAFNRLTEAYSYEATYLQSKYTHFPVPCVSTVCPDLIMFPSIPYNAFYAVIAAQDRVLACLKTSVFGIATRFSSSYVPYSRKVPSVVPPRLLTVALYSREPAMWP